MSTQSFRKAISRRGVEPRIRFVHDGTNFEDYVIKVSKVKRDADLTAGIATVTLNNGTGLFNFWKATNTALNESAQIQIYVSGAAADLFTLFSGTVQDVEYIGSRAIVRIKDHMADMLEKPLGTGRLAHLFSSKTWPVDEMVWRILIEASGAALDSTETDLNADINWNSFVNWRDNYLGIKNYGLKAKFTSQKIRWGLLKIAQLSHSYIYIDTDGRVAFAPPFGTGFSYDETNSKPRDLSVKMGSQITRMLARHGYSISADTWTGNTGYLVQGAAETQYSRFSYDEESRVIWHNTLASAQEDRSQTIIDLAFPVRMFKIVTNLAGMTEEIANQITVNDTLKSITNATPIVEEVLTDMESRTVVLKARWSW